MEYQAVFTNQLARLKQEGTYRSFVEVTKDAVRYPAAAARWSGGAGDLMICCGLDYLGMSQHPKVIAAVQGAVAAMGLGAGGSRNLGGTSDQHVLLEAKLARFHERQRSALFASGFAANHAAVGVLASRLERCVVISDELNHASIIEGARSSRADKLIYRHNDLKDLERKLQSVEPGRAKLVVFESIYSMEGDIAPVREILSLARRYGALTVLNEVHAIGIFGRGGRGIAERQSVMDQPDLIVGSLSKAIGALGGYVAGSDAIVDFVRSFAPGFIFTSALPPAVLAGAIASLDHLQESEVERTTLLDNARRLREQLLEAGIDVMSSTTHIVPVLIGSSARCNAVSKRLLEEFGIMAVAVNYPTVKKGTERLRLVVTARHDASMISRLVDALKRCLRQAA